MNRENAGSSPVSRPNFTPVVQLEERRIPIPQVAGSSPVGGAKYFTLVAQMEERQIPILKAAGSTPVEGAT